jgi:hypothetical protein
MACCEVCKSVRQPPMRADDPSRNEPYTERGLAGTTTTDALDSPCKDVLVSEPQPTLILTTERVTFLLDSVCALARPLPRLGAEREFVSASAYEFRMRLIADMTKELAAVATTLLQAKGGAA